MSRGAYKIQHMMSLRAIMWDKVRQFIETNYFYHFQPLRCNQIGLVPSSSRHQGGGRQAQINGTYVLKLWIQHHVEASIAPILKLRFWQEVREYKSDGNLAQCMIIPIYKAKQNLEEYLGLIRYQLTIETKHVSLHDAFNFILVIFGRIVHKHGVIQGNWAALEAAASNKMDGDNQQKGYAQIIMTRERTSKGRG